MYDSIGSYLLTLLGLLFLLVSVVILATKGRGDRVVTWRGFGVVFEIKPCRDCLSRHKFVKEK